MKQLSKIFKTVFGLAILCLAIALAPSVASGAPGDLIWRYKVSSKYYVQGSPVIGTDNNIYVAGYDGGLKAISPDGSLKWQYKTGRINTTPAIGNDETIYIGSEDGYFYAINSDGTLKWRYKTGTVLLSSPSVGTDGTSYVCAYEDSFNGHLYAINPDGSLKWRYKTKPDYSPVIGADDTIYIGGLIAINPNGSLKWTCNASCPFTIGTDGTIYYLKRIYATIEQSSNSCFANSFSPTIGHYGIIYAGSHCGYLYAINIDNGSVKWRYKTGRILSRPVIGADRTIYVGGGGSGCCIYAINPDGSLQWQYKTDGMYSSPAIGSGAIYAYCQDNYLYAIEISSCIPGSISVSPTFHEFGDVFLNYSSKPRGFTIKNANSKDDCDLEIQSVAVTVTNSSEFAIRNNNCPEKLAPGKKCKFEVVFTPISTGPRSAAVSVSSDGPDTPLLNIPLNGNGVDPDSYNFICMEALTQKPLAHTIASVKYGDWNDPDTWDLDQVPASTDVVLIRHHKITNLPPAVMVETLCNHGELTGMPNASLEIRAPGGISNYETGIIKSQGGTNDPTPDDCGNSGKNLILKAAAYTEKYGNSGDWWWIASKAGPIYNAGQISGGNGASGTCAGNGGEAIIIGRNVTNDVNGLIRGGKGGNGSSGKGGRGGLVQISGNMGGHGNLISLGTITAGDGGSGAEGGKGGSLRLVSQPGVSIGPDRTGYADNPIKSAHNAGRGGTPDGKAGRVMIEPGVITIGAGVELGGGDITIFGGGDWILDLSESEDTIIESGGNIILAVGSNSTVDLRGNTETILKAAGDVRIFADELLLDEGVNLPDIFQASEIETNPGKILSDIILTGTSQITGKPGASAPVRVTLSNGGPTPHTCRLTVADSESSAPGSPIEVEVSELDSIDIELDVTLPSDPWDTDIIRITAVCSTDPDAAAETEVKVVAIAFINDQTFSVDENSAIGTSVGSIITDNTDPNAALAYFLTTGNTDNVFAISSNTGMITVNNGTLLDYEKNKTYVLTVQVSDGVYSDTATVTVNVGNLNDNSPVLNDRTFSVDENSADDTVIGRAEAGDADNNS
ncbi:MAG: PQQ-binding-like beta-propeller repeat protein, partial [Desulfobacterales bacterium]|nr:PQQ-binding-like beta-propeller repeat protein [Desulfobacterales bacterium]